MRLFDHDGQLNQVLRDTKVWVAEALFLPTVVALLGHRVAADPDANRPRATGHRCV